MIFDKILSVLNGAASIGILPHISADGDALGSSFALALSLKKLGKKAEVILEEGIPGIYGFLPSSYISLVYDKKIRVYDVVVALDTGDTARLGSRYELFEASGNTINIDHHHTNTEFGFYNHVEPDASSTGEIVYKLLKAMGAEFDKDIATCLYLALATDTGGFRFSNTCASTHEVAADLIRNGVDVAGISKKVFETQTLERVKLTGVVIQNIEFYEYGKVAIIVMTDEMIKNSGASSEDCDGMVNIGRNVAGVEVSVMLRETVNGEVKANLRSNSYVDVSGIASMFKGGGHKRAAGFTVRMDMNELKKQVLNDIKEALVK